MLCAFAFLGFSSPGVYAWVKELTHGYAVEGI